MGGSQLKQLKATLKAHNLTGQTNGGKKKKGSKRQPKQYDREEKNRIISQIREDFSPFEVKKVKNKRVDDSRLENRAVGKPGISKQIGEEQRSKLYEAKLASKNKRNGFLDKRFGERNKDMSEEDKMLERFTRERQSQSRSKNSLFDLNDDGDEGNDIFDGGLTHLGETLQDDFEDDDLGLDKDGEARGLGQVKRSVNYGNDGSLGEASEPARKKTKAEVMKEIIAKSKFYKHERQKAQEKLEDQIDELDQDFDDIFSELKASEASRIVAKEANDTVTEPMDKEYDIKVKELTMERRAAPSDRTKTEEELRKEAEEKRDRLERQRTERMSGMLELEDGEGRGVEDLDDGFWANSDEEEEGVIIDSDEDIELDQSANDETESRKDRELSTVSCPARHEELLVQLKNLSLVDHPKQIRRIIHAHQPKLAEGNKEKLGKLTAVLLRHILFLSNQEYSKNVTEFAEVQNSLLRILESLSEQYNQAISVECRIIISEMQERFKTNHFDKLQPSDLVFFNVVGSIFSTSDQYHLVVTPCSILIAEFLDQMKFNTIEKLAFGAILARISLQYQRISRRYVPELTFFFEKCLASLLNSPSVDLLSQVKLDSHNLGIDKETEFHKDQSATLHLHRIFGTKSMDDAFKITLLMNILESLDNAVSLVWKELPAFQEISLNIVRILNEYKANFPSLKLTHQILEKINKLRGFNDHSPLTLQHHKPLSIPSHTPKFEENFNPDKKSYDPDKTRSEINKMKSLLKKERKFTMKEIRKDTKFEARQRIASQKESSAQYHSKMAHIINTISTEEGSEKNKYDREKKLRNSKK